MNKMLFFLGLTLVVLASCEKKEVMEELAQSQPDAKPRYFVKGIVAGNKIDFTLGDSTFVGITKVFPMPNGVNAHRFAVIDERNTMIGYMNIDLGGQLSGVLDVKQDLKQGIGVREYTFSYAPIGQDFFIGANQAELMLPFRNKWYTTRFIRQQTTFSVLKAEDIIQNDTLYKAITAKFECRMCNILDTNDVIVFERGEANILVGGIPE